MRDRYAHTLPGLEQTRLPHHILVMDTEARIVQTRGGERQSWMLGAATYDRIDPRRRPLSEARSFFNPLELWTWILERVPQKGRAVL